MSSPKTKKANPPSSSQTHDESSEQQGKRLYGRFSFIRVLAFLKNSSKESPSCLVCGDFVDHETAFHPQCKHYYCRDCTVSMAKATVLEGNEDLFPLRCCNKPSVLEAYLKKLP